mmetsp:Transcript_26637/g.55587  ORF Transcript_26637/g.55587 Transcript_26637/m.55587 type:complete len:185 (-) Transcript_26637:51-605(-)
MSGYAPDLTALSNLLSSSDEPQDSQNDRAVAQHRAAFAPSPVPAPVPKKAPSPTPDNGDIWSADEVPDSEGLKFVAANASKLPPPKHEVYYKQAVDSGDVYLGLQDKTPSSTDCTHIVVKAHFPQHKLSDIDLDVTKDVLKAVSDSLSLTLYLPTSVDADEGSAKFDSSKGILSVELPVVLKEW